ncbi:MAG: bifunctional precorrin-2 dehydrogenase/sirohydrochlorin ferrochelatase [Candidatus Omnitrophota bacterium]
MKRYYPIALNLKDKRALVVGGGSVAQRKVDSLLRSGALVRVISPQLTPRLKLLFKSKEIEWIKRRVRSSDVKRADIIIAATDDPGVNEDVSRWARNEGVWANVVDRSHLSDFISPAVFRARSGIVAVYTDGKDPVLSRDLKNFLKEKWSDFLRYRNRS